MVGDVQALFTIDYKNLIIGILLITTAILAVWKFWEEIQKRTGIETKWGRSRREQSEMITNTASDLAALQKKHDADETELKLALQSFINETKSENALLMAEMKQYADNRIHDRAQSFQIQKELTDAQKDLRDLVHTMSIKLDELKTETENRFSDAAEKQNKRVQAEIKDKIAQSYRHYNAVKKINHMELEALEDLIVTYEDHGGENSFVHSVVQKEMYTWELIQ